VNSVCATTGLPFGTQKGTTEQEIESLKSHINNPTISFRLSKERSSF
jgi:hypothetical protein